VICRADLGRIFESLVAEEGRPIELVWAFVLGLGFV